MQCIVNLKYRFQVNKIRKIYDYISKIVVFTVCRVTFDITALANDI